MVGMLNIALLGLVWTQWGHDPQNTFRVGGAGEIGEEPTVEWLCEAPVASMFRVAPAVADINLDGTPEVIAIYEFYPQGIIALDGKTGNALWDFPLPDSETIYGPGGQLALGDLSGDERLEVLAATREALYCVSNEGSLLWRREGDFTEVGSGYIPLKIADLDGDGKDEVLLDSAGYTLAVDGDGSTLWKKALKWRGLIPSPAIGDVDGDGQAEVVVASDEGPYIQVVSTNAATGTVEDTLFEWHNPFSSASLTLDDLDGDGNLEVILGIYRDYISVVALEHQDADTWEVKWTWTCSDSGTNRNMVGVGDANGDGVKDVFAKYKANDSCTVILALDGASGSEMWRAERDNDFYSNIIYGNSIADIDGDGKLEVGVILHEELVYFNAEDGSLLWAKDFWDPYSVAVGDVDGDSALEIVVADYDSLIVLDSPSSPTTESSTSPWKVEVVGLRGGLLLQAQAPAQMKLYSYDGRLVKELRLGPGKEFIPLKPGVYLWRAGKYSGKAVVKP